MVHRIQIFGEKVYFCLQNYGRPVEGTVIFVIGRIRIIGKGRSGFPLCIYEMTKGVGRTTIQEENLCGEGSFPKFWLNLAYARKG